MIFKHSWILSCLLFFLVFSPTITKLILMVNIFSFRFLFIFYFLFFFNIRLTPHSPHGMAWGSIHTLTRGFVFLSYLIFLHINLQYMRTNFYIFFSSYFSWLLYVYCLYMFFLLKFHTHYICLNIYSV